VTLHYSTIDDKERNTEVKIYTVNFPPVPMDMVRESPAPGGKKAYVVFIGLLVTAFAMLMLFRLKASRRKIRAKDTARDRVGVEEQVWYPEAPFGAGLPERKCKSSIYLFGQFQVFDKESGDITGQFSPLLKELFLLIATSTIRNGRGVASTELDEILWHDKSDKDAKNNRAVNIAKLKALLEKVGHCTINKESGFWQFQTLDESICIDYKKYIELLQQNSVLSADYIHPLINIARRGAFLYQTEYNWLDNIKSEVSNAIIDRCVNYIEHHSVTQDPEFVIEICNCIFYFDHLNEEALIYKCKCLINLKRHTLANTTYLNFAKDYKQIYGENFPKTFQEIVG
jgi:two-component SAPR family response regulator